MVMSVYVYVLNKYNIYLRCVSNQELENIYFFLTQ